MASFISLYAARQPLSSTLLRASRKQGTSLRSSIRSLQFIQPLHQRRLNHTHETEPNIEHATNSEIKKSAESYPKFKSPPSTSLPAQPDRPEYEITFTCKPCSQRSTHRISKQGYHWGSVLITCPECKNRHVISDHLKIFGDTDMTIEDMMRDKRQLVKKGTLDMDSNLEIWEDGTRTVRPFKPTYRAHGAAKRRKKRETLAQIAKAEDLQDEPLASKSFPLKSDQVQEVDSSQNTS